MHQSAHFPKAQHGKTHRILSHLSFSLLPSHTAISCNSIRSPSCNLIEQTQKLCIQNTRKPILRMKLSIVLRNRDCRIRKLFLFFVSKPLYSTSRMAIAVVIRGYRHRIQPKPGCQIHRSYHVRGWRVFPERSHVTCWNECWSQGRLKGGILYGSLGVSVLFLIAAPCYHLSLSFCDQ